MSLNKINENVTKVGNESKFDLKTNILQLFNEKHNYSSIMWNIDNVLQELRALTAAQADVPYLDDIADRIAKIRFLMDALEERYGIDKKSSYETLETIYIYMSKEVM